jgi:hypothetical protein
MASRVSLAAQWPLDFYAVQERYYGALSRARSQAQERGKNT